MSIMGTSRWAAVRPWKSRWLRGVQYVIRIYDSNPFETRVVSPRAAARRRLMPRIASHREHGALGDDLDAFLPLRRQPVGGAAAHL